MKLKNLRKKIRRLEARLQEGPRKLAKLKRKLEAAMAADAAKARRKLVVRARQPAKPSTPAQEKRTRSKAKPAVKSAGAKEPGAARKVKRKLNLSPERRAQLSAAMKARWTAKRAVPEASPPSRTAKGDFTLGQTPQAQ